jgi:hypothetical protein
MISAKPGPPKDRILGVIREGLAIVSQRSPADTQAYRDMVMNVAKRSAEAAKEGGFLGIGGTLVSQEEQRTIDEISAALTLQRARRATCSTLHTCTTCGPIAQQRTLVACQRLACA